MQSLTTAARPALDLTPCRAGHLFKLCRTPARANRAASLLLRLARRNRGAKGRAYHSLADALSAHRHVLLAVKRGDIVATRSHCFNRAIEVCAAVRIAAQPA